MTGVTTTQENQASQVTNRLTIKGIDSIEFYVSNAYQAAHFYRTGFGFQPLAFAGFETGLRDQVSYVLKQRHINFVLRESFNPDSEIFQHVARHGDTIKDITFEVEDAVFAFEEAVKRGAKPILEPIVCEDDGGEAIKATIAACGDLVHSFIQKKNYKGTFFPYYEPIKNPAASLSTGLVSIDRIVLGVESGERQTWVDFYTQVLGFKTAYELDVESSLSGMQYSLVQNEDATINISIVEPVAGWQKSQIQEYLMFNRGAGVQHIALRSNDIIQTVQLLRHNGIEFLRIPPTYYETLTERSEAIQEDISVLQTLQILADANDQGYLMQIFSKPIQSRPTLFIEVVQRGGIRLSTRRNIEALFAAVEQEQAQRGNV
jgi:4-hydroxyphenylpyruvate dioxygenase